MVSLPGGPLTASGPLTRNTNVVLNPAGQSTAITQAAAEHMIPLVSGNAPASAPPSSTLDTSHATAYGPLNPILGPIVSGPSVPSGPPISLPVDPTSPLRLFGPFGPRINVPQPRTGPITNPPPSDTGPSPALPPVVSAGPAPIPPSTVTPSAPAPTTQTRYVYVPKAAPPADTPTTSSTPDEPAPLAAGGGPPIGLIALAAVAAFLLFK